MGPEEWMKLEDMIDGKVYYISARNANHGIWRADKKAFEISRTKFSSTFLCEEIHWDACSNHGTAKPINLIGDMPEEAVEDKDFRLKYLTHLESALNGRFEGAIFCDIDGTIFSWKDHSIMEGVLETMNIWKLSGYEIILTTLRGKNWPDDSPFTIENTMKMLANSGVPYHRIIWDVASPRCVVNDSGSFAINHKKDEPWPESYKIPCRNFVKSPWGQEFVAGIMACVKEPATTWMNRQKFWFNTSSMSDIPLLMSKMGYGPDSFEMCHFISKLGVRYTVSHNEWKREVKKQTGVSLGRN